ncbi:GNAT family N-acetyltransferase [Neobacillus sp. NRS-1170]|uniref:GNAT family N-acetyltransferase n=1 Tax=Neobacillus sp. NRS-1170 TaxID=3233898 RepID=UPI003D2C8DF0
MLEDIFLRKVEKNDIVNVFNLSNEDYVREYSLNKEKIEWDEHVKWFEKVLQNDNFFYVVSNKDHEFLGQIRYKVENKNATVSISLSKEIVGKGKSRSLLTESMVLLKKECPSIENIIAYISKDNVPSQKLFVKANFTLFKEDSNFNQYIYKY